MTILIDVRLLGRGGSSGIEEYTKNIVGELLARDEKNRYLLFYNGFYKKPLDLKVKNSALAHTIDWRIPNRLLDLSVRLIAAPKLDHLINFDLIYSPHLNIIAKGKSPRILTFHDLSFLNHPQFFDWQHRLWLWLQNYQKAAREASVIIVNSHFTKADVIAKLTVPPEKVAVIYPGIGSDFRKIGFDNPALHEFKKNRSLDYPFILFLGTLEPRKNIRAVIRAFDRLKTHREFRELRLILAGRPGWLYREIFKEAAIARSSRHIIFWGPVENRDRVFLYNLARAFVYPSFFEGFGFPPLEAQSCGSPVIVSNRTSLPEIVQDSALLVDPWKIDELAETLKRVLTDEKLRKQLIEAGFKNISRFSWNKAARELLNIFDRFS